jgi:DNA polymerase-3 subunit delta
MKLDARQATAFLRDPGRCRMVLLHGEDEGQIRERAQALTKHVAGSLNDPFLVTELTREGWGQIPAEMTALSMIGGRRVIIVRDAAEAVLVHAAQALKGPGDALLVLEAPGLGKGKLRSFAEASPDAAAIACYPDEGRALSELIRAGLVEHRVSIDSDALTWLVETLPGDRAVLRGEIEKLALLVGPGGSIDLEAARSCSADAAAGAGDDSLLAALGGDIEGADEAVEAALQDGLNGVALLRMALMQLQKFHLARLRIDAGLPASEAVKAMRPPVFFRATGAVTTALGLWTSEGLLRVIEEARQVELACKRTGSRPELLARRFVAGVARLGARRKNVVF